MAPNYCAALDAIDAAPAAYSPHQLGTLVAKALGFTWFYYVPAGGDVPLTNGAHGWDERYRAQSYGATDPFRRMARLTQKITPWSRRLAGLANDRAGTTMLEDSAQFGVNAGINVPLPHGFGQEAFLTFSYGQEDVVGADSYQSPLLYLIGARLDMLFSASDLCGNRPDDHAINLTPQESLCLTWISRGKTMSETATIVGLQRRTVEFHLTNARMKLGAATVAQAAADGVRLGCIG